MSTLQSSFKEAILAALLTVDVQIVLIDTTLYTFSAAHRSLADVPLAARVATSLSLSGKSVYAGSFRADAVVFPQAAGPPVGGCYLFAVGGSDAASPLILWTDIADESSQTQFPFSPSSGNLTLLWTNGEVFAL